MGGASTHSPWSSSACRRSTCCSSGCRPSRPVLWFSDVVHALVGGAVRRADGHSTTQDSPRAVQGIPYRYVYRDIYICMEWIYGLGRYIYLLGEQTLFCRGGSTVRIPGRASVYIWNGMGWDEYGWVCGAGLINGWLWTRRLVKTQAFFFMVQSGSFVPIVSAGPFCRAIRRGALRPGLGTLGWPG